VQNNNYSLGFKAKTATKLAPKKTKQQENYTKQWN